MATSASGGNSFCASADRLRFRRRPKMPQQRIQNRRPALADFAPARARAMQQLQPVRLDLEKTFVAREFFDGGAVRRQPQTRFSGGLNFFQQILHGRINCGQNRLKARNAAAFPVFDYGFQERG